MKIFFQYIACLVVTSIAIIVVFSICSDELHSTNHDRYEIVTGTENSFLLDKKTGESWEWENPNSQAEVAAITKIDDLNTLTLDAKRLYIDHIKLTYSLNKEWIKTDKNIP